MSNKPLPPSPSKPALSTLRRKPVPDSSMMTMQKRSRPSDASVASSVVSNSVDSSSRADTTSSATDVDDMGDDAANEVVVHRGAHHDDQRLQYFKENILQILAEKQFPVEQSEIIVRSFESRVVSQVRATFVSGTRIHDVLDGYAEPKIGITFMAGADAPQVNRNEGAGMTQIEPDQKDASWRVDTAGALLKNFEVDKHMGVSESDNTFQVVQNVRQRTALADGSFYDRNPTRAVAKKGRERDSRADTTVTIDSDNVKIVNDLSSDRWDLECTLIEVDQSSLMALLVNYKTLIHGDGPALTPADTNELLDTMIEDARRLCLRSPILFRMSTRRHIFLSKNTRYGVDQGTQFQTLTTSHGIKNLVEVSASYFNSLANAGNKDKAKDMVRPRFLQMLVLLLALLNDDDLQQIARFLEVTYKLRAEREHLELLILKVLPLMSINSEIFVDGLVAAVDGPSINPPLDNQPFVWSHFVRRRLQQGYILPGTMEQVHDSWIIQWPENGIEDSSVFNQLQYAGDGNKAGGGRTINEIPPLNIHSSYSNEEVTITLRDNQKYISTNIDLESIIRMSRGTYSITEVGQGQRAYDLEIKESVTSEPVTLAISKMNSILNVINGYLATPRQQNPISRALSIRRTGERRSPATPFPALQGSGRLSYNVANLHSNILAVAYKTDGRKITRRDLIRNLSTDIAKLRNTVLNVEAAVHEFETRRLREDFRQHIDYLWRTINEIKLLIARAEQNKARMENWDPRLADEPVAKVMRPLGADQVSSTVWHPYRAEPDRAGRLLIEAERRVVSQVDWVSDDIMEVFFEGSPIKYFVSPLRPLEEFERAEELRPGECVQLVGQYIVVAEPNELVTSPVSAGGGGRTTRPPIPRHPRSTGGSSSEAHELPTDSSFDLSEEPFSRSHVGGYSSAAGVYNTPACLLPGRQPPQPPLNRVPVGGHHQASRMPAEHMAVVNWLKITGIEQQTVSRRRSQQSRKEPAARWIFR